jgi:hypothetical protein
VVLQEVVQVPGVEHRPLDLLHSAAKKLAFFEMHRALRLSGKAPAAPGDR